MPTTDELRTWSRDQRLTDEWWYSLNERVSPKTNKLTVIERILISGQEPVYVMHKAAWDSSHSEWIELTASSVSNVRRQTLFNYDKLQERKREEAKNPPKTEGAPLPYCSHCRKQVRYSSRYDQQVRGGVMLDIPGPADAFGVIRSGQMNFYCTSCGAQVFPSHQID